MVFNLKVGVLYFLVTALAILTVYRAIDDQSERAEVQDRNRLADSVEGFEILAELDEFKRANLARRVVESELPAYVAQLDEFRAQMQDVYRRMKKAEPPSKYPRDENALSQARRKYLKAQEAEQIDEFVTGLADKVASISPGQLSAEFETNTKERFEMCMTIAWDKCYFDFIYDTLTSNVLRNLREQGIYDGKMIVIVADARGVGWAHSKNPHWAHQDKFIEEYPVVGESRERFLNRRRISESVGIGRADLVAEMDLVSLGGDYFLVTVVPMSFQGAYKGSVMVGSELDDVLVQKYRKALDLHVGFVLNGSLIQSTINSDEGFREFVEREIQTIPKGDHLARVALSDADLGYNAMGFYFEGGGREMGLLPTDKRVLSHRRLGKLKVVLAVEGTKVSQEYDSLKTLVLLLGVMVFFAGFVLIFVAAHYHAKPFEKIDEGIHEILSGNHAYQFGFAEREDLASAMAQNLNLMVAVLSGNPLPDDSEASRWVETLMIEDELGSGLTETSEIVFDETNGQSESAEQYYRRVYEEYLQARQDAGKSVDGISYVKFVEKLVRSEKTFKERHGTRHVRFNVVVRDGQVILAPESSST